MNYVLTVFFHTDEAISSGSCDFLQYPNQCNQTTESEDQKRAHLSLTKNSKQNQITAMNISSPCLPAKFSFKRSVSLHNSFKTEDLSITTAH